MIVTTAEPVQLDFDDYVVYTETHPDDAFELIDGVIYKLAPKGDPHARTHRGRFLAATGFEKFTPVVTAPVSESE